MPNISLCKACKEKKICIADVQHGNISHDHEWYIFRSNSQKLINYSPSHYFVWDEESKNSLIQILCG